MAKKYRFFFHYYKAKKAMSVHWRGSCNVVDHIICQAPCETKWRKTQPKLVMQGYANEFHIAVVKGRTVGFIYG